MGNNVKALADEHRYTPRDFACATVYCNNPDVAAAARKLVDDFARDFGFDVLRQAEQEAVRAKDGAASVAAALGNASLNYADVLGGFRMAQAPTVPDGPKQNGRG